ncbi:hypothetical protein M430DRAFT_139487 [Amorphotheca resinae ATCC 22711]|uniref:Multicopper oxidase n=1 Tax=Amorphotheca resinae ATCC 22711 TaxID=857342 RepID=A0A2T3B132_AMORE|nr:hypothetical protein M430DRAFT_139487 [Amorphotheca resinae ATCC 22711]PSS18270.1 hypothetical protein M430DRAFT_139487 [Amorphotheca resinae ATCC 22711]
MLPIPLFSACLLLAWTGAASAALRRFNFTIHTGSNAPDGFTRQVYLINGQQPAPLIDINEGDDLEVFVQNDLPVASTIHWHGLLQRGTPQMDGVPGVSQYPIPPGGNFTYKFSTGTEYGFYWYHSHFRAYYDDAIRGPLLIRPSSLRRRPFESLANDTAATKALLQAEMDATSIMLNDWTHSTSDTIYATYFENGVFPSCVDSLLANGMGQVRCLPDYILEAGTGLGLSPAPMTMAGMKARQMASMMMAMTSSSTMMEAAATSVLMASDSTTTSMAGMLPQSSIPGMAASSLSMPMASPSMSAMSGMLTSLTPRGCTPPMMFKPGYNESSLPADTCKNTTSPLMIVTGNATLGWLALNLVNSGSVAKLSVSLDAHSMYVYAADGLYVDLQEAKVLYMALGQRYSVMIKLDQMPGDYALRFATYPTGDMQQVLEGQAVMRYSSSAMMASTIPAPYNASSIWTLVNGSAKGGATQLDPAMLAPFDGNRPPSKKADLTKGFQVSQTGIVEWVIDKYPYSEPKVPIVFGNSSDGWMAGSTLHMPFNSTIDIILTISNDSMDMMGHPMHLHGHKFWVLGSGDGGFPYASVADAPAALINTVDPPFRDTTDLPASGWVAIRYLTDNPGAWLLHCHIQWHLVSGMGLVLVEGESQIADILRASNFSMASPTESMTTATATATSTPKLASGSTSASSSLVVEQGHRGVAMVVTFSAALALVLAGLL